MKKILPFSLLLLSFFFIACNGGDKPGDSDSTNTYQKTIPVISYSITDTQPHDTSYFTEGFEFYNNTLIESTGLNGKSKLVQTDPKTGKVLQEVKLAEKYFGEGATVLNDTIYQLTYKEHAVFVYSAKNFKPIKELPLNGEGWGLTNDGKVLIASNGSSDLYFYEPQTFKLIKTLSVKENGSAVPNINELEYVNGFIYANQWTYDYIVKIDVNTGEVVGKMDLSNLRQQAKTQYNGAEVLNGIAYNPATKKLHVTGKNWPMIFELQLAQ